MTGEKIAKRENKLKPIKGEGEGNDIQATN